jgi:hypothetical protein
MWMAVAAFLMAFGPWPVRAWAQAGHHVASSKIELGLWTMHPVYATDNGTLTGVVGFLALADRTAVSGENLIAVWYAHQGTTWTSTAWTMPDPCQAVRAVKHLMGIPDAQDHRWDLPCLGEGGQEPAPPGEPYTNGVLDNDPLAFLVHSAPDRNAIIRLLVQLGYPAANIPVDLEDECTMHAKLDVLAGEAASMIASGDESILSLGTGSLICEIFAGTPQGPAPTRPPRPATAPPWSPPGTVPTAPNWTPGGWPPAVPGGPSWSCRTQVSGGETKCVCKRIQRWGRWETKTCWFLFTCIRWHEILETETCETDFAPPGTPCPLGGPPPAGSTCSSVFSG